MAEQKGISRFALYRAFTGKHPRNDQLDSQRASQLKGHPITIDSHVEDEREWAFVLVKQMEIRYEGHSLQAYYQDVFDQVKEAYATENPKRFEAAIQLLVDTIYMV